ncbi:hypothetical protein BGW80DRAFT_1439367 [Lactifluus volemus]|nr:hypothetical protein BGW80DRAFT_1439367 [Lactifluus volemus]
MSKKRSVNDNSDPIPPAAQSANKQRRTSTPAFRVARESSGTAVNRSSRLTTIRTNAHGQTVVPSKPPKPKRKRQNTTSEWLIFRQSCLDELLRHDGLSDSLDQEYCISCKKVCGVYKCKDCFSGSLLRCRDCLVNAHRDHPLHHVEIWNGRFFAAVTLQSLGLRVQLGHGGAPCPLPSAGPENFCIFDTYGVHYISVDFCDCRTNGFIHQRTQLLRARWFPATSLQYRYPEFHRVFRIWRNLLMLKRAGRGQDPAGAGATAQGELAVECPACPHPGRNLPEGWELAGALLFLYTLFLAVDANFKLKGKDRGIHDPELAPGWASFVEEGRYQEHIAQYVDQPEINTCQSEHDALVRAVVRCTPGYSVTGVGLCICPRHCLIRKNGAGDLQKGERYCNMDYIILSALAGVKLPRVVITYDVGCQWCKNFERRMEELADDLKLDPATIVEVGIPSWHINGHGENCKSFCLSYMDGVGRTCGEEVETTWAQTNALGTSVREMGPGARHETLNDQWCGWNFRKIVGFRSLFLKRLKEAYAMRDKHRLIFQQFSSTFSPQTVQKWEATVLAWKNDRSKPNPYMEPASWRISPHKVTLTMFLTMALDLEEQQRHLQLEVSKMKGTQTSKQSADLEEKRTSLRNRILRWRQAQLAYTPCVASLVVQLALPDAAEALPVEPAESMPLYLPSSLPQHLRQLSEITTVLEKECRLRIAQADDALAEIRRQRRIISGLWQFKRLNVDGTGNRACTRMRTLYNRFNLRTQRSAGCYRAARSALLVLDPNGSWQSRLKDLKDDDIRGPGKDDNGPGNSSFEPSWIWLWVKAQARKQRWEEEVLLIQEEMRRVVAFHEWKAQWWRSQACCRTDGDPYAEKQAHLCERLAQSCVTSWLPTLKDNGAAPSDWEASDISGETSTDSDDEVDDDEGAEEIDDGGDEKGECSEGDDNIDIDLFEVED